MNTQQLINHIRSTTAKSTRNRRRTSTLPSTETFLTWSTISAALLIIITIITVLSI